MTINVIFLLDLTLFLLLVCKPVILYFIDTINYLLKKGLSIWVIRLLCLATVNNKLLIQIYYSRPPYTFRLKKNDYLIF